MNIINILPVLIPGVLIQIGIQAYYIKHCWENKQLTQKQKTFYIISIALFNLPAVVFYLFLSRKRDSKSYERKLGSINVDENVRQGIFVFLVVSFEIFALNIAFSNAYHKNGVWLSALLATCFLLLIINEFFVKRPNSLLYYLVPAFEIVTILAVYYLDDSSGYQFIVFVVVASVINTLRLKDANKYALSAFALYLMTCFAKLALSMPTLDSEFMIRNLYANVLIYLLVYAALYTMKKQLLFNRLLQSAYQELEEQSSKLEEMAALAERNRIAGDIHDNVGHLLTTAIISIEAGEKLLDQDRELALVKLSLAQEQIKSGLQSIRYSVRAIKQGCAESSFQENVQQLITQIQKNTDLKITEIIEVHSQLLPIQQNVILQAIKECATNSLKHGKSTHADLLIQEHSKNIQLAFTDNGKGCAAVQFGFGLLSMYERVQSIGGTLQTLCAKNEGFTVSMIIPIGIKAEAASNETN